MKTTINYLQKNKYLIDSYKKVWNIKQSRGSWLCDNRGYKYLDFHNGFGSNPLGWNYPELIHKMKDINLSYIVNKPSNADIYTEPFINFISKMKETTLPSNYPYIFLIDGGALAVENGLKIAFDWKSKLLGLDHINDPKLEIIHFKNAFHGRSGYTMSLTNTDPNKTISFPKFEWPRFNAPISKSFETLYQIEECMSEDGHKIAGLIIEPIQCEGGDRYIDVDFLIGIQYLCNKYDILFILDEVQTGFYSTGKPWCFQHYDLKPDLVIFGKKSQQCGVFGSSKLDKVKNHCFNVSGRISSTWGGNLLDMIRSTHIMDIIKNDDLSKNVICQGSRWLNQMKQINDNKIKNIRGLGTILAFDCNSTFERDELIDILYTKYNHLVLSCGYNSVRFRPHLAVTSDEIDESISRISLALNIL